MSITVTKEFRFEAAHRLMYHPGACKNIHGHSYKVVVSVTGNPSPVTGVVVDFSFLSAAVKDVLEEGFIRNKATVPFDHSLMLHEDDPLWKALGTCPDVLNMRLIKMVEHPTAEYMARLFLEYFDIQLEYLIAVTEGLITPEQKPEPISKESRPFVSRVEVWETAKAYAVVDSDDVG